MPSQTFFNLSELKRQRIIEVALEEFASHSYGKASLSNIVARAGIAKGSMYQYFADKKDLYLYLLDLAAKEKIAYIEQGVDFSGDFYNALEQIILAGIRFSVDHPQLSRIILNIMGSSGEEVLQEVIAQSQRMSVEYFKQMVIKAQGRGDVRDDLDPELLAHILNSILGSALSDYLLASMGVSIREFLSNPEHVKSLNSEKTRQLVSAVLKVLRCGLTTAVAK